MAVQLYTIGDLIDHLCAAVDQARIDAAGTAWASRIEDAYEWLLMQEAVEFDAAAHELTYTSESGKTYRSNGQCRNLATGEPCKAWGRGNPCKHRCAARLLRRAVEAQGAIAHAAAYFAEQDAAAAREQARQDAQLQFACNEAARAATMARIGRAQAVAMELFA